ncbi:MAG: hypothetical protein ACFB10_19245 [Salibacteraceae bacterium]
MNGIGHWLLIRYVFIGLFSLWGWSTFATPGGKLYLEINGKFQVARTDTFDYTIQVINSETLDTHQVSLQNGKFHLQLKYEAQYLLVVDHKDTIDKRIIISTSVPIGTSGYKIKLELDMREEGLAKKQMGILEYNGFDNRFVVRQLRNGELKRRKYEFEGIYSELIH